MILNECETSPVELFKTSKTRLAGTVSREKELYFLYY